MRHADLRREASAVIAKAESALLYDTAVWYLVWVCVAGRIFIVRYGAERIRYPLAGKFTDYHGPDIRR